MAPEDDANKEPAAASRDTAAQRPADADRGRFIDALLVRVLRLHFAELQAQLAAWREARR